MFEFADRPSDCNAPRTLRVIRVPHQSPLRCVSISDRPICHAVHWIGERTIPHSSDDCVGCVAEAPMRIEVFIAVYIEVSDCQRIVTLSDFAAIPLFKIFEAIGTLHGVCLTLSKPGGTKNSRVRLVATVPHPGSKEIWPTIDCREHLSRLWGANIAHVRNQMDIPAGENLQHLAE